jgi:4-oxalocrotonate tautomerase
VFRSKPLASQSFNARFGTPILQFVRAAAICSAGRAINLDVLTENYMPLINVKLIDGVFSEPQKKQIVTKLTDATVSIEGENLRAATWVVSEEVKSGDWGMGGNTLTAADVKPLAAGRSAQAV